MKQKNNWQKIIGLAVPLSLGLPIFLTFTVTANAANSNSLQSLTQANIPNPEFEFQVAQNTSACYRVVAEYGLYVREEPTVYSEAIGVLNFGEDVTTAPGGTEYWTPISAPIQGYVWTDWLTPCQP